MSKSKKLEDPYACPPGEADCTGRCGARLPKNANYFDRDNNNAGGFKTECKQCRSEKKQQKEEKVVHENIMQIRREGFDILGKIATSGGSDVPHMAEIFQHIIRCFDGPAGYARFFFADYLMTQEGSAMRQKFHNQVVNLSRWVSDSGAAQKSYDEMTTAELEDEVTKILKLHEPKSDDEGSEPDSTEHVA